MQRRGKHDTALFRDVFQCEVNGSALTFASTLVGGG